MAHVLHLYQEEHCLLDALVDFVAEGLRLDESVLVLGSTPRWDQLLERLQRSGVDARRHALRGQLRLFGVQLVLATCFANGAPVRHKFGQVLGAAFGLARMRYERVRVVSELTDALWRAGQGGGACALELIGRRVRVRRGQRRESFEAPVRGAHALAQPVVRRARDRRRGFRVEALGRGRAVREHLDVDAHFVHLADAKLAHVVEPLAQLRVASLRPALAPMARDVGVDVVLFECDDLHSNSVPRS